jgi:hypothetical protein
MRNTGSTFIYTIFALQGQNPTKSAYQNVL